MTLSHQNPLEHLSEVAYSVRASDWSCGRCRGKEGACTTLLLPCGKSTVLESIVWPDLNATEQTLQKSDGQTRGEFEEDGVAGCTRA